MESFTILGGARSDSLGLVEVSSPSGFVMMAVEKGLLSGQATQNATGTIFLTYPVGYDDALDFAVGGANQFSFSVSSTQAVPITFSVLCEGGGSSAYKITVPSGTTNKSYSLAFTQFAGQCNFSTIQLPASTFMSLSSIQITDS